MSPWARTPVASAKNPGILARIRSFAANIMRANNVANMTDARYRNAIGGLDQLFTYHTK